VLRSKPRSQVFVGHVRTREVSYFEVERSIDKNVGGLQIEVGYVTGMDVSDALRNLEGQSLGLIFAEAKSVHVNQRVKLSLGAQVESGLGLP